MKYNPKQDVNHFVRVRQNQYKWKGAFKEENYVGNKSVSFSAYCSIEMFLCFDMPDIDSTIVMTRWLLATGVFLSSCEWLTLVREFGPRGMFDKRVLSANQCNTRDTWHARDALLSCVPSFLILLSRALAAAALPFVSNSVGIVLTLLLVTHLWINHRCRYALEGSDQMQFTVTVALWIDALLLIHEIRMISLAFIAAQASVAYFAAGMAKLRGADWANGKALTLIMHTESFGLPGVARRLARNVLLGV
jgi:hypothetical protein